MKMRIWIICLFAALCTSVFAGQSREEVHSGVKVTFQSGATTNPANKMNARVFDGKFTLKNGELLEFVWVDKVGLWVGKYEVTLGQLTDFLRDARKRSDSYAARYVEDLYDLTQFPAVKVSWDDANNACKTLNRKYGNKLPDGAIFRLPTENEWETIAKLGDKRMYPWGDSWPPTPMNNGILPNLQGIEMISNWEKHHSDAVIVDYKDGWASLAPVAKTGANKWGIYGLAGNVTEWCEGWYDHDKKLRLLKGPDAYTYNSRGSEITYRSKVEGQSPVSGWFFWGTIRNQGHNVSGFRIVIGEPAETE